MQSLVHCVKIRLGPLNWFGVSPQPLRILPATCLRACRERGACSEQRGVLEPCFCTQEEKAHTCLVLLSKLSAAHLLSRRNSWPWYSYGDSRLHQLRGRTTPCQAPDLGEISVRDMRRCARSDAGFLPTLAHVAHKYFRVVIHASAASSMPPVRPARHRRLRAVAAALPSQSSSSFRVQEPGCLSTRTAGPLAGPLQALPPRPNLESRRPAARRRRPPAAELAPPNRSAPVAARTTALWPGTSGTEPNTMAISCSGLSNLGL